MGLGFGVSCLSYYDASFSLLSFVLFHLFSLHSNTQHNTKLCGPLSPTLCNALSQYLRIILEEEADRREDPLMRRRRGAQRRREGECRPTDRRRVHRA